MAFCVVQLKVTKPVLALRVASRTQEGVVVCVTVPCKMLLTLLMVAWSPLKAERSPSTACICGSVRPSARACGGAKEKRSTAVHAAIKACAHTRLTGEARVMDCIKFL